MASSRSYQRPNYFVALHINDKDTIAKLVDQQMSIISKYPCYTDFKTPPNGFHLTLAVLQLASVADHQACVGAMNQAKPTLKQLAKKAPALSFRGVDHFNTKVVYAKVKFSGEFLDLVDSIKESLYNAGIQMDSSTFRPHLTLFNVKRSVYADRSWEREPNIGLSSCHEMDTHFGWQAIDNIQVCQMGTLPEEEGTREFYRNIFNMKID